MKNILALVLIFSMLILPAEAAKFALNDNVEAEVNATARSYYFNDRRIIWSGQEATFGVEGALGAWINLEQNNLEARIGGNFYLNQRYGRNILRDPNLDLYSENWEYDVFEIDKLYIEIAKYGIRVKLGKDTTPFGRTYFPIYTNDRKLTPFIRGEAILWRETGLFGRYQYKWLILDIAVVNGEEDKDTNSSKGVAGRIGLEQDKWALGVSAKWQDGIGSGGQKTYKNHIGIDGMIKITEDITLSGEAIYDEYGLKRDFQGDFSWPRSLYYRDIYYKDATPIYGIGWYADIGYAKNPLSADLSYGEYYPQNIGNPYNDQVCRRCIAQVGYDIIKNLTLFGSAMIENKRETEAWRDYRENPYVFLVGAQYKF